MSDLVGFEAPKMDWLSGPDLDTRFKLFGQRCELLFKGTLKPHGKEQKINVIIYCCGPEIMDLTCATLGIYQMSKREISANIGNDSKNISSHNQILFLTAITCETCDKITDLSMFSSLKPNYSYRTVDSSQIYMMK